jgi:hypothetical protein
MWLRTAREKIDVVSVFDMDILGNIVLTGNRENWSDGYLNRIILLLMNPLSAQTLIPTWRRLSWRGTPVRLQLILLNVPQRLV